MKSPGGKTINPGGCDGPLSEHQRKMQVAHRDDMDWGNLRFDDQFSKMLFHPMAEDPAIPNANVIR